MSLVLRVFYMFLIWTKLFPLFRRFRASGRDPASYLHLRSDPPDVAGRRSSDMLSSRHWRIEPLQSGAWDVVLIPEGERKGKKEGKEERTLNGREGKGRRKKEGVGRRMMADLSFRGTQKRHQRYTGTKTGTKTLGSPLEKVVLA